MEQWVEAGETYVIEVTSDKPAANGKYLLALRRYLQLWNIPEASVAHDSECRQVVAVTGNDRSHHIRRSFGDFGNRLSGERWAWPCHSVKHAGHYANYYTFTVDRQRPVSIELTAPGGGHLILRKGTNGSGPILGESDSRKLSGTLAAGTYTVEVAMNAPNGNGHSFNLEIKAGADIPTPPMACVHTASLGVVVDGDWSTASAAGCGSFERSGSPSRWYKFTLTSAATVDISVDVVPGSMTGGFGLYSIRGSYLYLSAGDNAYSGLHIAENNYIAREH